MADLSRIGLPLVDGLTLEAPYREALRPGELVRDREGRSRRLPRFFYEVDSWRTARETELAPGFSLWEFIYTDMYEAEVLHGFPRYLPCATTLLATHLALFRSRVNTYVHIAANGAYRSPGHAHSRDASPHQWGVAVNLYRIGDDWLENQETIERYGQLARELMPWLRMRPYGHGLGFADDHLHLDLGYVTLVPHDAPGEPDAAGRAEASAEASYETAEDPA